MCLTLTCTHFICIVPFNAECLIWDDAERCSAKLTCAVKSLRCMEMQTEERHPEAQDGITITFRGRKLVVPASISVSDLLVELDALLPGLDTSTLRLLGRPSMLALAGTDPSTQIWDAISLGARHQVAELSR
jgi:hypothetical protein